MRKKKEILKIKLEKVILTNTGEKGRVFAESFYPQISFWEFLRIQAFYIGKLVWVGEVFFYFVQVFF